MWQAAPAPVYADGEIVHGVSGLWSEKQKRRQQTPINCWKSVSALYAWHGLPIANVSIARQSTVPSTIHQVMSPAKRYRT